MHRIVGRESTDLIKIGGYRVGAGEVETALLGHEGVFGGRRRRIARRRSRAADRRVRGWRR
jgi:acyl-CoA synthetase (AMP-forming)/AMP-acid ligase II